MIRLIYGGLLLLAGGLAAGLPGLAEAARLDTSQGLLWQIESPAGVRSYLFGTIHVGEPAVLELPPPVEDAFNQSQQLVVEVVLQSEDFQEIGRRMKLLGSDNLRELVGVSLYARVIHAANGRGINQQLFRLQPWAVATLLFTPLSTGLPVLDRKLQMRATHAGKIVTGLETLDEQLAVFEQLTLDNQIDLLHEAVLAALEFDVYYGELMVAYLNRDLNRLVQLAGLHLAQDTRLKKSLQLSLVDERNRRMIERLLPILDQVGVFVAVGALHLPGDSGLLQRLHDLGYRVTRRY